MTDQSSDRGHGVDLANEDLILVYVLPYVVYVGAGFFLDGHVTKDIIYIARLVLVSGLLYWAHRWYLPVTGPYRWEVSGLYGVVFGVLGLVIWCALCLPFADSKQAVVWTKSAFWLRFAASGFLVPLFEEWLMRGLVFRMVLQWEHRIRLGQPRAFFHVMEKDNIASVIPGQWSIWAMAVSSLIFALGHGMEQWLAAFAYGLLMGLLWVIRKDLVSCMVAHGVTNMGLAFYVLYSGCWKLW